MSKQGHENSYPAGVLADNVHDRRLIEQVRPPGWVNPQPQGRYHLCVIGGGTAGLVAAAGAAGLGARVALIERNLLGGDCLNVGCVPSQGVLAAARAWRGARSAAAFGVEQDRSGAAAQDPVTGSFAAVMDRMRRIRSEIAPHDGAQRFRDLGVDVYLGEGRFTSGETVKVGGQQLRFRRAVIATGARAALIPIPGLEQAAPLTNETVFNLTRLPARLTVIGAGPIGCELAQAFASFGSEVTLLEAAARILPREDEDAAGVVQAELKRSGVRVLTGVEITGVEMAPEQAGEPAGRRRVSLRHGDGAAETLEADQVLLGVGRQPNTENLGLAAAGVETDRGGVKVDQRLRTSNPKIYACGDVASAHKFTHAADAQARIVIQNALFFGRARTDRLVIPWVTYTSPEVAQVGLTAAAAAAQRIEIDTVRVEFDDVDRARLDGETAGFLKVHVRKGSDRIVGATLVGEDAGDMIGEIVLAMTAGVGLGRIAGTIHPYPTRGEIIKKAADAWRREKLTPTVRGLLAGYFRLLR